MTVVLDAQDQIAAIEAQIAPHTARLNELRGRLDAIRAQRERLRAATREAVLANDRAALGTYTSELAMIDQEEPALVEGMAEVEAAIAPLAVEVRRGLARRAADDYQAVRHNAGLVQEEILQMLVHVVFKTMPTLEAKLASVNAQLVAAGRAAQSLAHQTGAEPVVEPVPTQPVSGIPEWDVWRALVAFRTSLIAQKRTPAA